MGDWIFSVVGFSLLFVAVSVSTFVRLNTEVKNLRRDIDQLEGKASEWRAASTEGDEDG